MVASGVDIVRGGQLPDGNGNLLLWSEGLLNASVLALDVGVC